MASHRFGLRHDCEQASDHFRSVTPYPAVPVKQEIEIRVNSKFKIGITSQALQQRGVMRDEPRSRDIELLNEINGVGQNVIVRPIDIYGEIRIC